MKATRKQFNELSRIEVNARKFFHLFEEGTIDKRSFKYMLKGLVLEMSFVHADVDTEIYNETIDEQFESYDNGSKFLLSAYSSGSLLNQFEVYDEIEVID